MLENLNRRRLLEMSGAMALVSSASACVRSGRVDEYPQFAAIGGDVDETYWRNIGKYYPKPTSIINLEHGYWGQMSRPVLDEYLGLTKMVNAQSSIYARSEYRNDFQKSIESIAIALGAEKNEIAITRNATESFANLITQYKEPLKNRSILWADTDYPAFKNKMQWLADTSGAKGIQIDIPVRANKAELIAIYQEAIETTPDLKLLLVTHVSNQHGMVFPIKEIAALAKAKGVDVICDAAQSWGLLDYQVTDLNVDWAVFNLHKWIGSPVGVGALYMREGSWDKIAPFPGEPENEQSILNRVHLATSNFASFLAVPAAIKFHNAVGAKNKEMRLRSLRDLWANQVDELDNIEILGGTSPETTSGMCSFRIKNDDSLENMSLVQKRLETEFGIFTVVRNGLSATTCIRVTPQVYTSSENIETFVNALKIIDQST